MPPRLTIWCNGKFTEPATAALIEGTRAHELVFSPDASESVLVPGKADPALERADIAFGQPDVEQVMRCQNLRWVEVTTAGYTRFDREDFKDEMRRRGAAFSNASSVFADPCAQHVLAMMLALGRQLLPSYRDQLTDRSWHYLERRYDSRLLTGETVLMFGFGAIGRRLVEILSPFKMKFYALRRRIYSETGVHVIPEERLTTVLPLADHIVNILPENDETRNYVNARRLSWCKRGAKFYNVGRGTTVDQNALLESLESGKLSAAYLDVTDPEPLPPSHPLWYSPNCYITPHTAGGRRDQDEELVAHFLKNLAAFERGEKWTDRIV